MAQRRRPQLGEIVSARNSPWRCRSECDGERGADDERRADGEDLGSERIVVQVPAGGVAVNFEARPA